MDVLPGIEAAGRLQQAPPLPAERVLLPVAVPPPADSTAGRATDQRQGRSQTGQEGRGGDDRRPASGFQGQLLAPQSIATVLAFDGVREEGRRGVAPVAPSVDTSHNPGDEPAAVSGALPPVSPGTGGDRAPPAEARRRAAWVYAQAQAAVGSGPLAAPAEVLDLVA